MARMTWDRDFAEEVLADGATHVFFVPAIMLPALAAETPAVVKMLSDVGALAARA